MGHLKQLKKAALRADYEKLFEKFLVDANDAGSRKLLDESVDSSGLTSTKTMQVIGLLQKNGKVQKGLYAEFRSLNERLEGKPATGQDSTGDVTPEVSTQQQGSVPMSEAPQTPAAPSNVVSLNEFPLTDKDKERIKQRLAKEEEKVRSRLMKYEQKQVERLKARAEKRAQRQGMKIEQMQEIKDRKEKLTVLKEQMNELRAQAKKLKDEIKVLKPQRKKKEKSEESTEGGEQKAPKKDKSAKTG